MIKVKTPGTGPNKPNKLTLIFGGTIATIILLIVLKVLLNSPDENIHSVNKNENKLSRSQTFTHSNTGPLDSEKRPISLLTKVKLKSASVVNPQNIFAQQRFQQEKLIKEFKATVHLDIALPQSMKYIDLELDNRVVALLGNSPDGKSFAVLATDEKVTPADVIKYLDASTESFGFLKNHEFQADKIITFPAPESTGLKPLTIIPATEKNGKDVYAAMAERKDGKGTYLFMMHAPTQYFDQNEDGLEKMLQTVVVKP